MQIRTQFLPNLEKAAILVSEVVIAVSCTAHQNRVNTFKVSNSGNGSPQISNVCLLKNLKGKNESMYIHSI